MSNKHRTIFRIGDIRTTRIWLSVERKPLAWWRWGVWFGPTYNGTTHGICVATPLFVLISHIREATA